MKKILLLVGIIFFCVLIIASILFFVRFGNWAFFLGESVTDTAENENDLFIGTWRAPNGTLLYRFHTNHTYYSTYPETIGSWRLENTDNNIVLEQKDGATLTFHYVFTMNTNTLTLTNILTNEKTICIRQ